ncbi:MAG: hypothetical protein AAB486_00110 [Patescibacteria group bacterium]
MSTGIRWLKEAGQLAMFLAAAVGLVSVLLLWASSERMDLPNAGTYPLKSVQIRSGTFWSTPGLVVVFIDEQHRETAVKLPPETVVQTGAEDQLVVSSFKASILLKKDTAIDTSNYSGAALNVTGVVLICVITYLLWLIFGREPKKK